MAYVTGTANSLTDLLTAIQNACTTNGWTLSGNVLHKGTCYIEMKINTISGGGGYYGQTVIAVQGGTGIDGSNNLIGRSNTGAGLLCGGVWLSTGVVPFAFPAIYDIAIHSAPDEVFVTVNYSNNSYQSCGFGQSAMPGLVGTGNWYAGAAQAYSPSGGYYYPGWSSSGDVINGTNSVALFAPSNTQGVDHSLDAVSWTTEGAIRDLSSLLLRQPNQWNGESVLIPMRVYASRPSGFVSPVLECAHARFVSIANLNDKQVITLGTDKWKVYPMFRRSTALNDSFGSWYAGYAFRYDGP